MKRCRSALLSTLAALCGCATAEIASDKPALDGSAAAKSVVLCKTTLADLQSRLGHPSRDGLLHSNRVVSWITAGDPLIRYLAVLVNERGVVTDLYWDIPTEVPWVPSNQCIDR